MKKIAYIATSCSSTLMFIAWAATATLGATEVSGGDQVNDMNAAPSMATLMSGSGRVVFWRGEIISLVVRAPLSTATAGHLKVSSSHGITWTAFTGTLEPTAGTITTILNLPTASLGDDDYTLSLTVGALTATTTLTVRDTVAASPGMYFDGPLADEALTKMTWLAPVVRQTARMDYMTTPLGEITPYAGKQAPQWSRFVSGFDTLMAGRMLYWLQDSTRPTSFVPPYAHPNTSGEYSRKLLLDSVLFDRFPAYGGLIFDYDPLGYSINQGKYLAGPWNWGDAVGDLEPYFNQSAQAMRADFITETGLHPPTVEETMRLGAALGFAEAIGFIDSASERWAYQIGARSPAMDPKELSALKTRCQSWFTYVMGMNKRRYIAYMATQKTFDPTLSFSTYNTVNHCPPRDGSNHPVSYEPLDFRWMAVWDDQAGNPEHIYETALTATLLNGNRRPEQPLWVVPHLAESNPGSHFRNMMLAVGRGSTAAGSAAEASSTGASLSKTTSLWDGGVIPDRQGKLREVSLAGQFIERFGGALTQARPVQRLGLLYSGNQICMTPYAQGAVDGWYKMMLMLSHIGLPPYPVTEQMLAAGLPAEMEAIVVINQSEALPPAAQQALEVFTARGGTVLMDTQSTVDWPFAQRSPSLDVPRRDAGHPYNAGAPFNRNDATVGDLRRLVAERAPRLRALLQPQVSQVVLDSVDTNVAVMELRGGEATFVAIANDAYVDLAQLFTASDKKRPEYPLVFSEQGYGTLGSWLPLQASLAVGPKVPTTGAIYDLLTRTRVTPDNCLGGQRLTCDLTSIMGRMYAVYPRPVGAGALTASQNVQAGDELACRYQAQDAEGKPLAAVIPLEITLTGPDGAVQATWFRGTASNGICEERLPTSAGGVVGAYKLGFRQLLDGQGVTVPIQLQAGKMVQADLARPVAVRDPQTIRRWLAGKPEIVIPVFDPATKPLAERAAQAIAKLGGKARIWENPPLETYVLGYVVKDADKPANERVEHGAAIGRVQFRNYKEHVNYNIYCSPVPGWRFGTSVLLLGTINDAGNPVAKDVADSGLIWSDGATSRPGGAVIQWVPQLFGRTSDALVVLGADADGLSAAVAALDDLPASDPVGEGVRLAREHRLQSSGVHAAAAVPVKTELTAKGGEHLTATATSERAAAVSVMAVQAWNDRMVVDLGRWGNNVVVIDPAGETMVLPDFFTADGGTRLGKTVLFAQSGPLAVAYDGAGKPLWKALGVVKTILSGTDTAVVDSEKKLFTIDAAGKAEAYAGALPVVAPAVDRFTAQIAVTNDQPTGSTLTDVATGTEIQGIQLTPIKGNSWTAAETLLPSPDGKALLVWRPEHGFNTVQIYRADTKQVATVTVPSQCLMEARFANDGQNLAISGVEGDVVVLDLNGKQLAALNCGAVPRIFALPDGRFAIGSSDGRLIVLDRTGAVQRRIDLAATTRGRNPEAQFQAIRDTPLVPLQPVSAVTSIEVFDRFFAYILNADGELNKITIGEQKDWQFMWYPVVQGSADFPQARTYTITLTGAAKYLDELPNNQPFWDPILALRAKTVKDRPLPHFIIYVDGKPVGKIMPEGGVLKPFATTIIKQGFVDWTPKPNEVTTFTGDFAAPAGIHQLAIEAVDLEDCMITGKSIK